MDHLHSPDNILSIEESLINEPVVQKRRSSVFQSLQVAEDDRTVGNSSKNPQLQEETFNLEEYIICLRNERKEWLETLKERKRQRRGLMKKKLSVESQGQHLDYSVLTEHEKAFVSAKPNYHDIYKNYKKLSDISLKTQLLRSLVYKLNRNFILQMEGRLQGATKKIIKESVS
ncbi:uncharacterized protein LOC108625295 isoform X2 [Ceratina calcarata]|uniref:Uncharacterized protein LOC108625295 isoform X2 n=1 Tax=Ceratina calcarata TaxID=156304 RepID=A0AAJ7N6Z1_9HYME|nr:uncharacterized protein LOC108625295 isoform X2 [Ceratina calcarata]